MKIIESIIKISDFFLKEKKKFKESTKKNKRSYLRFNSPPYVPLKVKIVTGNSSIRVDLINFSLNGLHIKAPQNFLIGDTVKLLIEIEDNNAQILSFVVHRKTEGGGYGLEISAVDSNAYHAYYKLVAPIIIGSSLKKYHSSQTQKDGILYNKTVFFGQLDSALTIWTAPNSGHIKKFEFESQGILTAGDSTFKLNFFNYREDQDFHKPRKIIYIERELDQNNKSALNDFFKWVVMSIDDEIHLNLKQTLTKYV